MLRAVARLEPVLNDYDYCSSGSQLDDENTHDYLRKITSIAKEVGAFDERVLFRGENANVTISLTPLYSQKLTNLAQVLREEFKTHFRNVTRIMDCVGCDKCRLWGKIQTTGVATALKVLFELDEKALRLVSIHRAGLPQTNRCAFDFSPHSNLLQRSEIVALMNTLYRMSESLKAVDSFRRMWKELDSSESTKIAEQAEKITAEKVAKVGSMIGDCWRRINNIFSQPHPHPHPSPAEHNETPPRRDIKDEL